MGGNVAVQASEINWELFLGLFLPAFGALQLWLIKVAREDRDLYWLVRKQIGKMGWATIVAITIVLALANYVFTERFSNLYAINNFGSVFTLALMVTITSLPFYDAVARLPKKDEGKKGKSDKR